MVKFGIFLLFYNFFITTSDYPISGGVWYAPDADELYPNLEPSAPPVEDEDSGHQDSEFILENRIDLSGIILIDLLNQSVIDSDRINFYVNNAMDLNIVDVEYNNALHLLIKKRLSRLASKLLEKGIDINARNVFCDTPLSLAIQNNLPELAIKLLSKNANPNIQNSSWETPFTLATTLGNIELARYIWLKGGDPNYSKINPLMRSIIKNNKAFTLFLINQIGVDVNVANSKGYTPLMLAILKDNCILVKSLLAKGANILAQAEDGSTPEILAKKLNKTSLTRKLIISRLRLKKAARCF